MRTVAICYNRPCGSVSATALLTSKLWFAWIRAARSKLGTPTIEILVAVATGGRPQWQLSPGSAQVSRRSRAFECETFLSGHAVLHRLATKTLCSRSLRAIFAEKRYAHMSINCQQDVFKGAGPGARSRTRAEGCPGGTHCLCPEQ